MELEFLTNLPVAAIGGIVIGVMLLFLATGMWIAFALGITGVLTLLFITRFDPAQIVALQTYNRATLFVLTSLPMFILTGEILVHTRLSTWLFDGLAPWVVNIPGRLFHTNIVGCTAFAGVSGSSTATTLTIGKVTYRQLHRRGYNDNLAVGSLAGAGTLGLLIPPSIIPIVYAVMVGESVGKLFMAGLFPGLMVAALFSTWIAFRATIHPWVLPTEVEKYTWADRWKGLFLMGPVLSLMLLILGSIYAGIATPTEAAAMGVAGAIFIGVVTKSLTLKQFIDALIATSRTTAFVLLIVTGATILGIATTYLRIPAEIAAGVASVSDNVNVVLFMLGIVYIILGMFLDGISIMVFTLPLVIPIIEDLGLSLIWFEVYLVLLIELANITPPVGFNLYVIRAMSGHSLKTIAVGAIPFMLLLLVGIVILRAFPDLALWLPRTMF